tara:strand:+ start:5780 stop:6211 length:432 start_codon:yes stop_codon:yes gene_type:complete
MVLGNMRSNLQMYLSVFCSCEESMKTTEKRALSTPSGLALGTWSCLTEMESVNFVLSCVLNEEIDRSLVLLALSNIGNKMTRLAQKLLIISRSFPFLITMKDVGGLSSLTNMVMRSSNMLLLRENVANLRIKEVSVFSVGKAT